MCVFVCGVCMALGAAVLMPRFESWRGRRCSGLMSVIACKRECGPSLCCVSVCVVWQTDGWTPLYAASDNGHVEVVRTLVGAGAAVNQATVCEDLGGCWYLGAWIVGCGIAACACAALCACVCLCFLCVHGDREMRCSCSSSSCAEAVDAEQDVLMCV